MMNTDTKVTVKWLFVIRIHVHSTEVTPLTVLSKSTQP